jgi:hypothetical protein
MVILAGSDRRPAELPERGRDKHPLAGFKSLAVRIGDRTLIEHAVERLRSSRWFDPVLVAGPAAVYEGKSGGAAIVDTDGTLGDNVRAGVAAVRAAHPGSVVGFTVCDILPDPALLDRLMREYQATAPSDLWFPMVRAPASREQLGASAWKPAYGVIPAPGEAAVRVLPGHLVIGDTQALRLPLLYRLLDLGYRTRNRSVLRATIPAAELLRRGSITREHMEDTLRKLFVRARWRRAHPERRVVLPIVEALFLARDIDTVEEASELGGEVAGC